MLLSHSIALTFRTEHDYDTAMLCVEFQNYSTNEMDDIRDSVRYKFKMCLGRISYIGLLLTGIS